LGAWRTRRWCAASSRNFGERVGALAATLEIFRTRSLKSTHPQK